MSVLEGVLAVGALVFFLYLLVLPSSKKKDRKSRSQEIAQMTGFMGGDVEDAMIARHALDRAHGDATKSSNRDVATAVSMQQAQKHVQNPDG